MKPFAMIWVGLALLGIGWVCKAQPAVSDVAKAPVRAVVSQPPNNAEAPVLKSFKPVGDLTVPFYNDIYSRPVFSPDGNWIAAAGKGWTNDGSRSSSLVFLWNAHTRVLANKFDVPGEQSYQYLENLVWSPDGKQVAAWPRTSGYTSQLFVWDVASGAFRASIAHGKMTVTSACYLDDGRLLVSWSNNIEPPSNESHITLERDGKREKDVTLIGRSATFLSRRKGAPLALVNEEVGRISVREPLGKSSLCLWENEGLSPPLIELIAGEPMIAMELSQDEETLIFSGVKQQIDPKRQDVDALYALCDLSDRKIIWRSQLKGSNFSDRTTFSPDGREIWAHTELPQRQLRIDSRTGSVAKFKMSDIPYFSPDGKRAVQRVTENRGQKPRLSAFHVFEKRAP